MDKFDTVCNQILSEQMLLAEAIATLGDQALVFDLQRFNQKVSQCTDETCTQTFILSAQRIIERIRQKVQDSKILQLIKQYEGAPIAALKALYQMLFTR
jgi:hypothetical protein